MLRKAVESDKEYLYELITSDEKWTKFNGPYFPYSTPSFSDFEGNLYTKLSEGREALLIEFEHLPVGSVSCYWENEKTRWLEAGIVIYDHNCWGNKIGRKALILWLTHLFNTHEIARVGMTTWSGNPGMMACAKSLGLKLEATLRKVRYHQGFYYDSVKYGVLREEWFELHAANKKIQVTPMAHLI